MANFGSCRLHLTSLENPSLIMVFKFFSGFHHQPWIILWSFYFLHGRLSLFNLSHLYNQLFICLCTTLSSSPDTGMCDMKERTVSRLFTLISSVLILMSFFQEIGSFTRFCIIQACSFICRKKSNGVTSQMLYWFHD